MGKKIKLQLNILGGIFFITLFFVYQPVQHKTVAKERKLMDALQVLAGYTTVAKLQLDKELYETLSVNDTATIIYRKNNDKMEVFVGYYNDLQTISEAHSPLVCFPAQGWSIESSSEHSLELGDQVVNYNEMKVNHNGQQQLVYFWYQAYDTTASKGYKNKLNAFWNRITKNKQEHAFVRLALPFQEFGEDHARKVAHDFLSIFYPRFLEYVYLE